jgi:pyruvyl transferase EpsO
MSGGAQASADHGDFWGGRALINTLQQAGHAVLDPLIPTGASICLLDYPNNSNVGDSLIWLGEIAYLRRRSVATRYVCDVDNYDPTRIKKALPHQPVILMHGGGNFGTLWPELQALRLQVLRDFPDVPVIQMPQSLHFDNEAALAETAAAIRAHRNYTLLVRDQASYDMAVKHFECTVKLCPDMAFFIGPLEDHRKAPYDRFILGRTDHEKKSNWLAPLAQMQTQLKLRVSDWLNLGWRESIYLRLEKYTAGIRRAIDKDNLLLLTLWDAVSAARMLRGAELLTSGRVVIADRLHVHILSILLDKPHVLIDNSYRKLGNLHDAWTKGFTGVKFVETLAEALDAAQVLDERQQRRRGQG